MKSVVVALVLLLLVVVSRFVSVAGIDTAHYTEILRAYTYGPFRLGVFCLNFAGIFAVVSVRLDQPDTEIAPFLIAAGALFTVSALRHFFPIFLVAVIGDYLVFLGYRAVVKEKLSNKG